MKTFTEYGYGSAASKVLDRWSYLGHRVQEAIEEFSTHLWAWVSNNPIFLQ